MKMLRILFALIILGLPSLAHAEEELGCYSKCALSEPCWGQGICYKDPGSPQCTCCMTNCKACCDCQANPETCPAFCDGTAYYGCLGAAPGATPATQAPQSNAASATEP